jgi:hypothetical protein
MAQAANSKMCPTEDSDLEVVAYFERLFAVHVELCWRNTVTTTKGLGVDLESFDGISDLKATRRTIGIPVSSLTEAHLKALADLAKNDPIKA